MNCVRMDLGRGTSAAMHQEPSMFVLQHRSYKAEFTALTMVQNDKH